MKYNKAIEYESIFKQYDIDIEERITKDKVIRQNKRVVKYSTDKENYKISNPPDADRPKEIKMSPDEIRKRHKGAVKSARKAKSKSKRTAMKRARSMKKR